MYDYCPALDEDLDSQYEDRNGDPDLDEDTSFWLEDSDITDCWQYYPSDDNAWTSANDPANDWSRE